MLTSLLHPFQKHDGTYAEVPNISASNFFKLFCRQTFNIQKWNGMVLKGIPYLTISQTENSLIDKRIGLGALIDEFLFLFFSFFFTWHACSTTKMSVCIKMHPEVHLSGNLIQPEMQNRAQRSNCMKFFDCLDVQPCFSVSFKILVFFFSKKYFP